MDKPIHTLQEMHDLSERMNAGCICNRTGICWYCLFAEEAKLLEDEVARLTEQNKILNEGLQWYAEGRGLSCFEARLSRQAAQEVFDGSADDSTP